jgi:hypothetical protein
VFRVTQDGISGLYHFQVRLGMFLSAMRLYGITSANKAITLLNRVAVADYYTHAVTI